MLLDFLLLLIVERVPTVPFHQTDARKSKISQFDAAYDGCMDTYKKN